MNNTQWFWFMVAVISAVIMTNCMLFAFVEAFQSQWENTVILFAVGFSLLTMLRVAFNKVKLSA